VLEGSTQRSVLAQLVLQFVPYKLISRWVACCPEDAGQCLGFESEGEAWG